jgi:predicted RNase H-like nuclease (RuvC/YqgF family)
MSIWEAIGNTTNANRGFVKQLCEDLEYSIDQKFKSYDREQSHLKKEIKNLKAENANLKLVVISMLRKSIEQGLFTEEEIKSRLTFIEMLNTDLDNLKNQ